MLVFRLVLHQMKTESVQRSALGFSSDLGGGRNKHLEYNKHLINDKYDLRDTLFVDRMITKHGGEKLLTG